MKTNKDLTVSEFIASQHIKRAMAYFDSNPEVAKASLVTALSSLYR